MEPIWEAPELPPVCSEKAGCGKDTLMPLAITSIWSISIKVYMVSISQNLSLAGRRMFSETIDQNTLYHMI